MKRVECGLSIFYDCGCSAIIAIIQEAKDPTAIAKRVEPRNRFALVVSLLLVSAFLTFALMGFLRPVLSLG